MRALRPRCWIDKLALKALWAEVDRWQLRETGGALFGWRDGLDAVVAKVVGPGPNAKHGLRYFEPDGEWQVAQGRGIYAATSRKVAYVGDWHSHPFASPKPSSQDRRAARLIADDPGFRAPRPLSAIAGRNWSDRIRHRGPTLTVYVWSARRFVEMDLLCCRIEM